jgi:hypothetical protein
MVEQINENYASLDECEETRDSMRSVIASHRERELTQFTLIKYLSAELADQEKINNNQLTAINTQDLNLADCQKKYFRMLHWKNVEIVGVIAASGFLIWQMKK